MTHKFQSDAMLIRRRGNDQRSDQDIVDAYVFERRLSDKLRTASAEERPQLYIDVYREFYEVMSAEQGESDTARELHERARDERNSIRLKSFRRYINPQTDFLEVAANDGTLSYMVAPHVRIAYATDVQDVVIDYGKAPKNFRYLKCDGILIPLPDESVDFVYSDQFMEHLHPDDMIAQMKEVLRILRPGGLYRCNTPSRVTGPHDVSGYFDDVATGFHLKEYDYASIVTAFKQSGFRKVWLFASGGGREIQIPFWFGRLFDKIMTSLPQSLRRKLRHLRIIRGLAGLCVVGVK
ncbi:class I SAM-dependent methyltransferase [Methyloferula stellata]|uniref:class I SAM-dependent methyltransferase n=1 Tax=Methyloferula stellata TaxID=876270 RepID=UPI000A052BD8|nr:class I SAM-dependent methyltransferase [Methyloferula stellata]